MSSTYASSEPLGYVAPHPVSVDVAPQTENRNRLTAFFRIFLALPHLILVGGPLAGALSWGLGSSRDGGFEWSSSAGLLGGLIFLVTVVAWFAIALTGAHPELLHRFSWWFLRWRVRAAAYITLLRDDYPPFGDDEYPAGLTMAGQPEERDRWSVVLRLLLALPHLVLLWVIGIIWGLTTIVAWFTIVFTGSYPEGLYRFGVGALRWSTRVEAYLLLLHDSYPPFTIGK